MSQHSHTSIAFWREFFQLYRSMPELWLVRSKPYRNRRLKDESYGRLLTLLRQFDRHANIHSLKRKINNFRTSYRRELRKVLCSEQTYVPALWYFKDLDFLCDLETGDMQYARGLETEIEAEPEPLALQNQNATDEEYLQQTPAEVQTLGSLLKTGHTGMEFNEMHEVSSSSEQEHDHQVVIHHGGIDSEDDDIFGGAFHKEEDVLGSMEHVSDGEVVPEPYLENEADPDPDLEPEPVTVRLRTDLKASDFHDPMATANSKASSYGNQTSARTREGHGMEKSSSRTSRRNRRLQSSNPSDYGESSEPKRQRVSEELSPDRDNGRNRDRVIDRETDNECDLIGRRMAAHFRNMRPDQRLFAERIISEVLVFGRMNRLSLDSQFIPSRNL